MISRLICRLVIAVLCLPLPCLAQESEESIAINKALKISSLTFEGRPFHAVLEIGKAGESYSGHLEIWWVDAAKYRQLVSSPSFSQTKVVNGDRMYEKNEGDYYPRWLENFVLAVMDPIPMARQFRKAGPQVSADCLKHEDKPAGITDELTFAMVCMKSPDSHLDFVLTFPYFADFKDMQDFGGKLIARTYETRAKNFQTISARMTLLEELRKVDDTLFDIQETTPRADQISTIFVSTLKAEGLVEKVPEIQWPDVREGRTDGYMIVYARTDRTGQVRETSRHSSDNTALEQFGMEQALRYKFKPLVVDGVAEQIDMPLVLHFTSKVSDPIPELDDVATRKQITGCSLPHEIADPASTGKQIVITFQVHEDGGLMTLGASDKKIPIPVLYQQFRGCHFGQYKQNGKLTAYHANLTVTAR